MSPPGCTLIISLFLSTLSSSHPSLYGNSFCIHRETHEKDPGRVRPTGKGISKGFGLLSPISLSSTYPSLHPVKFGWPAGELQPCWTRGHGKRLYVERVKHRRIKTELEISVRVNKFFRHEVRKQFQIFTPGKIHVFEKHRSFCLFQV